jgi:hypothetical protein
MFFLLSLFNILVEVRYTLSILLGCAVCLPLGLGPNALGWLLGGVVLFNTSYILFMSDDEKLTGSGNVRSNQGKAKVKEMLVAQVSILYVPCTLCHVPCS